MLEESRRMQFGAYKKILEQGFKVGLVIARNNRTQFRVDKKAQITYLILKHKHDDVRDLV